MGALDGVQLKLIDSMDGVAEFKEWLGRPREVLGVDTETTGLHPIHRQHVRLAQFGDMQTGWAIPFERWGGVAEETLRRYRGEMVLHNSKFDALQLVHDMKDFEWPWHRTNDTMSLAHILDPLRPKGLKPLAGRYIDPKAVQMQRQLDDAMHDNKWTWATVPTDFPYYWLYGALDPVLTCHIWQLFRPQLTEQEEGVYRLEMGTTRVAYEMERRGAQVDLAYCERRAGELTRWSQDARGWIRSTYGIDHVTPDSLLRWFQAHDVPMLHKLTPGGKQSLDKDVMDTIDHPLADTVLTIRKAEKIVSSYLGNLIEMSDDQDVVHCNINTLGTRTARMSISDPALQTLPRKDPTVRDAFIPRPGNALVTCDYDQIEARLTAHFSKDAGLIAAFQGDDDFFCTIASSIFGEPIGKKDPRRQLTKNTIYGKIYGAGVDKMALTARVPVEQMTPVVSSFDHMFPGVVQMQRDITNAGRGRAARGESPWVRTPTGRRMVADDYKDYTLTNYLIQCHAAEILKRALIELDAALPSGWLILPVHDEVVLDVPKEDAADVAVKVQQIMSNVSDYSVPITASADVCETSWGSKYR